MRIVTVAPGAGVTMVNGEFASKKQGLETWAEHFAEALNPRRLGVVPTRSRISSQVQNERFALLI